MATKVDVRHLTALLGSAGKAIASAPGAKETLERMRLAKSPEDLTYLLQNVELGMEEPARQMIWAAAADKDRWRETHALLISSAERHFIEKFHASS